MKLTSSFPTPRDEHWKYTNVSLIAEKPLVFSEKPDQKILETDAHLNKIISENIFRENYLIYLNGYLLKYRLNPQYFSLNHHKKNEHLLNFHHNQLHHFYDIFEELNFSYHQKNDYHHHLFLLENSNTQENTAKLQTLYLSNIPDRWIQPRLSITIKNTTKLDLIEHFMSIDNSITNAVTEISLEKNAKLNYTKIQQENSSAFHIGRTYIHIDENASAQTFTFSEGSRIARSDIFINLKAEHAHCHLAGLYLSKNRTTLDHHTIVEHNAPHTQSHEFYRGILMDKSRAVFNGKIRIAPFAHKTETQQFNHNLLLSSDAEIDTKPELEIYHDDVKCTHGATIGQLDENALFYLESRGINKEAAKKILIQAFAEKTFEFLTDTHLREKICLNLR